MKKIFSLMVVIAFHNYCLAQNDTTIIYVTKEGEITTAKDKANSYVKMFKMGNVWHGLDYYIKSNILKSEGDYPTNTLDSLNGSYKNYTEDGMLENIATYNKNRPVEVTYFYKNGNKRSHILFGDKIITEQKGWDENGKEIKNYIVQQPARFKGGLEAWSRYLQKNLNTRVPIDAGAPAGLYPVIVTFLVNKEGYISEVKAISVPDKCKPCAKEAVSVVMNGPNWEPAIFNNEPVVYRQKQQITFEVTEDTKKKKKD